MKDLSYTTRNLARIIFAQKPHLGPVKTCQPYPLALGSISLQLFTEVLPSGGDPFPVRNDGGQLLLTYENKHQRRIGVYGVSLGAGVSQAQVAQGAFPLW